MTHIRASMTPRIEVGTVWRTTVDHHPSPRVETTWTITALDGSRRVEIEWVDSVGVTNRTWVLRSTFGGWVEDGGISPSAPPPLDLEASTT